MTNLDSLLQQYENGSLSRRDLLGALALMIAAPSITDAATQGAAKPIGAVKAAAQITVPVLLMHGSEDRNTRPDHSQRVYDALTSARRLVLIPGAAHNDALNSQALAEIVDWLTALFPQQVSVKLRA